MGHDDSRQFEIRAFHSRDADAVAALAARLTIGMAPWRDPERCLAAIRRWVEASMRRSPEDGALLVAVDAHDRLLGFASIEVGKHFSGEPEGYIGERQSTSPWKVAGLAGHW